MEFTNTTYENLIQEIEKLTGTWGAQALKDNDIAFHIASIAYIAGSEDPDRYAAVNLAIYLAGTVSELSHYRESDAGSLDSRLAFFRFGKKADPEIVGTGMDMLKLLMLKDYQTDQEKDATEEKMNPFTQGHFSHEDIDLLEQKIGLSPHKELFSLSTMEPTGWN
ncbi:hypothetical protein [Spirochaeta dissipatitropha]